jgi:hypothetical protein
LTQLNHQTRIQRIELLGTVEGDDAYFVGFGVDGYEFVGNVFAPKKRDE